MSSDTEDADPRQGWRAERAARRAERRRRFRERLKAHGLDDLDEMFGDFGLAFGMGGGDEQPSEIAEMQKRMDAMTRTIDTLSERVKVLERLAVQDEARLAAEIEQLRGASRG